MGLRSQAAIILKEVNPQLFLIGGIWVLLVGLSLLAWAAYLTLKHPEEMKRSRWLRRYKDTGWAQLLVGGFIFTSMGGIFILSALDGLGREMSDIEVGLGRGLLIVAAVAFIFLFIIKVVEKFKE
jgi:hypothetical protein